MNPDWLDGLAGLDGRNSSLDNNEMRLISLLLSFIRLQFSWTISIDESNSGSPLTVSSNEETEGLYISLLLVAFALGG